LSSNQRLYGKKLAQSANMSKVRLVAGGFRLCKVSRADNESGVIKAMYVPKGLTPDKSISETMQHSQHTLQSRKVYPAQARDCMGKEGLLIEGVYRPQTADELEHFYDPKDYEFLTDAERVQAQRPAIGEAVEGANPNLHHGPLLNLSSDNG